MRSELLDIFVKYIVPPLATLVASGGAWALGQLALWLKSKTDASKTMLALSQLAYLAELVVADVEATLRPLVKEFSADGQMAPEEAAKLKAAAVERLKALAKERGFLEAQKLLEAMAPSLAPFLSGIVERAVAALPREPLVPKTVMNVYGDPSGAASATVMANP
jgi:hypothetical protein